MLRLLSNVTYPGHARLATDRRLLEGDNWNCGCDGANRDEHLTLEPRDPPLGTRQNYTKVSDRFWADSRRCLRILEWRLMNSRLGKRPQGPKLLRRYRKVAHCR